MPPLIELIRQALTGPLPGQAGQIKMVPEQLPDLPSRWEQADDCREAAVLLLLYPALNHNSGAQTQKPELHFLLTRRPVYPGVHSGQISLPGGQREAGEALPATALREAYEEVGLVSETIEIIGSLSPLYIPPSNYCIYPFVAYTPLRPAFQPDPREVAELIETPLGLLFNPAIRQEEIWPLPNYGNRQVPFYNIFGHKVWGATAMVLSEFLTLLHNHQLPARWDTYTANWSYASSP
jgi:8-oxo-dGTP pyrophosphatase MutT (NUDIX family)